MIFAIYQYKSAAGIHVSTPLHLETPSHLPKYPIPLGYPWAVTLVALLHASKLALVSYFTYGNVHILMVFSQIIPSCLLPLNPKICSLHLCLLCCPACNIVGIVFINSIYMCVNIQYCVSLSDLPHSMLVFFPTPLYKPYTLDRVLIYSIFTPLHHSDSQSNVGWELMGWIFGSETTVFYPSLKLIYSLSVNLRNAEYKQQYHRWQCILSVNVLYKLESCPSFNVWCSFVSSFWMSENSFHVAFS